MRFTSFGRSQPDVKAMEKRAVEVAGAIGNPSVERERLQRNLRKGRRHYDRENPSRMRYFWRVWEFLFGRGEIRIHR